MTAPQEFRNEIPEGSLEIRSVSVGEARAHDGDIPRISGLGSLYNSRTTLGHFFQWDEEVLPGAWRATITRDGADIRSMFNHDPSRLLGRTTAGSLRLSDTAAGLQYEVDINTDDVNAMSVFSQVQRGDVSGASVWFRVIGEKWTEPTEDNGLERPLRQITEGELFEVGPVVFPAFTETTASAARALDGALAAADVSKRAALTAELLGASPSEIRDRISDLFARRPELRDQVCSAKDVAAAPAADDASESASVEDAQVVEGPPSPHLALARQRQLLLSERL